jgi:hypothetical protein
MIGLANIVKMDIGNGIGKDSIGIKTASSLLGLGSGLIAQNIIAGKSKNSFKKMLFIEVQAAVTGLVAKSANEVAWTSLELVKKGISEISQHAHD